MAENNYTKYDEDFRKSLLSLHQTGKIIGSALQRVWRFKIHPSQMGKTILHRSNR